MGNELAYRMWDGADVKKLKDGKASDAMDDLMDRLFKDGQVSVTQSAMFLDSTMIIPTGKEL
jgi:hypothetical protein